MVDLDSMVSRVKATSNIIRKGNRNYGENRYNMAQYASMLFTHIEDLNDLIKRLNRVIEDLKIQY